MSLGITAAGWAGIAGAVGGGLLASSGAKSAANTQAAAADRATQLQYQQFQEGSAEQRRQYDQTRADQLRLYDEQRADQAPYREQGAKSLAELVAGTAPGGIFTQDYQRTPFEADPGYAFRLSEGEKGIQRSAAAGGGLYSGATLKALERFRSGLASQEYGAYDARQNTREAQYNANRDFRRNNLASLAGVGQTATTATSNAGAGAYSAIGGAGQNMTNNLTALGQNYATRAGASMQDAAEARASGYVGVNNAIGSGLRQLGNFYQQQQFLGGFAPRPDYNNTSVGYGDTSAYGAYAPTAVANGGWGIE